MQAPKIALRQRRYNITTIYKPHAQLFAFTGSVFENSTLFPKKCNPVLETPPYQRHPRDNSRLKLCALNHRQKELYNK